MTIATRARFLSVAALGVAVVWSGCHTDDSATGPDYIGLVAPKPPTISSVAGISPLNSLAVIRLTSALRGGALDATTGEAHFGTPGMDKGTVRVSAGTSDFLFTKLGTNDVSYTFATTAGNPAGIALNAAATPVSFTVSGYPLAVSTITVPGQLKLTSPAPNAALSRTSPLTVSWTISGGAGSQCAVFIIDALGHTVFHQNLGAVASGVFTISDLASLATGANYVYGISYNYVLTNSNSAVLIGEACAGVSITLH